MRGSRAVAFALIAAAAVVAYAAGTGEIVATPPVTVVTVTSPTGSGSGSTTLQNTSATTFNVLVERDATCDPDVTFAIPGGNPIASFDPTTTRDVTIQCPPRGTEAMQRCLLHATNNANGAALGDFMGVCLHGESPPTLTPLQTSLDFGTLTIGDFAEQTLTIRNDAAASPIRRVYLMTSDIAGHFQLTTPCNPDAGYCDVDLPSEVGAGATFAVGIKCRPQAPGTHTAQVYVGTDTFQLLSLGVTLTCTGSAATQPALAVQPTTIEIGAPIEVDDATADVTVHLANAGGGILLVKDVRTVDVDTGAADDWTYTASGTCSGQLASTCTLGGGDSVDIGLRFDPSAIGRRRAALLVAYQDTLNRTLEIPLEAIGLGATLRRLGSQQPINFGMVPVGETSQLAVTLVNDGNRDATAMIAIAPSTMPPFSVASSSLTVQPEMPRSLVLECAPQAAGTFTTAITLSSPDLASPLNLNAVCEGTANDLYATPSALRAGEVRINAAPTTLTVQLQTVGGAPLSLAGEPTLEIANAAITLGPLSQLTTPATFDVTLAPQVEGAISGTIIVETATNETLRIPIVASAVEATYITSDTLDLGTFCVDQATASSNLTLLSTGSATIGVTAPNLGASPSPFELRYATPPIYPHSLASGKAAVVAVTPHRQRTAMTVFDTLTWETDAPGATTATIDLTARFIDSGAAIAPTALNFGEATVHLYSANGQRIVIQNCNPTPLVLDPPNIRTPFSIDSPGFPAMLNPNESVAFSVGFHPTRVGTVMDTLRITSPQLPGAPLEVQLIGTGGTGGDQPPDAGLDREDRGETSFYSCGCRSSGNPLGVLPIALVVAGAVFRRRRSALR